MVIEEEKNGRHSMSHFKKKHQGIYKRNPVTAGNRKCGGNIPDGIVLGNTQPIRYVAVLDRNLKDKIADECTKKFPWNTENIHAAPALMVLCTIKGLSGYEPDGSPSTTKGTHWQSFDAGVAAAHFCLAANALELGTLIMGRYDEAKLRKSCPFPRIMTFRPSSPWAILPSFRRPMKESR